ncbi:flagellar assembly protein FliX [Geminicoccaceae bacterium 1502E]|nr:flagellar assembly protein FliX [Geminicoccaceae bacterium 1502E]
MQVRLDPGIFRTTAAPRQPPGGEASRLPGIEASSPPAATSAGASLPTATGTATSALLGLQEVGVARRTPAPPARLMLEQLERLKEALLAEGAPTAAAAALGRAVGTDDLSRGEEDGLRDLRVRAAVELAKLERAGLVDREV